MGVTPLLFRLVLPLLSFTLVAVPLETYVKAAAGLFNVRLNAPTLLTDHLFFQAAACFYCITIVFECIVILCRPHIRASQVPADTLIALLMFVSIISVTAYLDINYNQSTGQLNARATIWVLSVLMGVTCIFSFVLHFMDYKLASLNTSQDRAA